MRGGELLDKMALVDPEYLEAAQTEPGEKQSRTQVSHHVSRGMAAVLAAVVLLVTLGATAFATGVFDRFLLYFKGDTQDYMEGIIRSAKSVSDGVVTLRIDGAIADKHACHLVVSVKGLTKTAEREMKDQRFLDLKAYAVSKTGQQISFWNWGAGVTSRSTGLWKRSWSLFDDADITFVVSCEFDNTQSMDQMESICVAYGELKIDLNVQEHMVPEYPLITEEESSFKNVTISPLGLYFDARLDDLLEEEQLPRAISSISYVMIRSDGTLYDNNEEFGLSTGTTYNEADEYIHITGAWKAEGPITVCILDLSEYSGIQINGINYYFAESDRS